MKKEDFNKYYKLLPKQSWLAEKEEEIICLINTCTDYSHTRLIFDLLERFHYVNREIFRTYLELIANYIVYETKFDKERTQIVATTMDSDPDSSQWILHELKPFLTEKGWNNVKMTTHFHRGVRKLNREGLNQLVLVDEFIGSGRTVDVRINYLKKHAKVEYQIRACFLAGMEHGIQRVDKNFEDFRCFLRLKKGISETYEGARRDEAIKDMTLLEGFLLPEINNKKLADYHLGFNQAEALYSSYGNVPNSVFPFFWWPYNDRSVSRYPILTRYERGFAL